MVISTASAQHLAKGIHVDREWVRNFIENISSATICGMDIPKLVNAFESQVSRAFFRSVVFHPIDLIDAECPFSRYRVAPGAFFIRMVTEVKPPLLRKHEHRRKSCISAMADSGCERSGRRVRSYHVLRPPNRASGTCLRPEAPRYRDLEFRLAAFDP